MSNHNNLNIVLLNLLSVSVMSYLAKTKEKHGFVVLRYISYLASDRPGTQTDNVLIIYLHTSVTKARDKT